MLSLLHDASCFRILETLHTVFLLVYAYRLIVLEYSRVPALEWAPWSLVVPIILQSYVGALFQVCKLPESYELLRLTLSL